MTVIRNIARMWNLLPCPVCLEGDGNGNNELCPACMEKLKWVTGPRCPGCGGRLDGILGMCGKCMREEPRPWSLALTVFEYRGAGRELVRDFKFRNRPELARALGVMMAKVLRESGEPADVLVPIPLHWRRYWERGYNQAELAARVCAQSLQIPCESVLQRRLPTQHQSMLARKERLKNLRRAFEVKPAGMALAGKDVWLCDDVLTTGMTLQAAAEPLLQLGARVRVLTLARA